MKQKYIHDEVTHNMTSPNIIVPLILQNVSPQSVVDFGCGIGTWLNAFKNHGVKEILGLDGKWCNKEMLFKHINESEFRCIDLEQPIVLDKTYDLVVSLEVAEHISEKNADSFVQSLTNAGEIIVFSAAFPGQGGLNHINEQWPAYWANKFQKHGYRFYDVIRGQIWNNPNVQKWYKQNMFLVVHQSVDFEQQNIFLSTDYNVIHPDYYKRLELISSGERGVSLYLKLGLKSILNRFKQLFKILH